MSKRELWTGRVPATPKKRKKRRILKRRCRRSNPMISCLITLIMIRHLLWGVPIKTLQLTSRLLLALCRNRLTSTFSRVVMSWVRAKKTFIAPPIWMMIWRWPTLEALQISSGPVKGGLRSQQALSVTTSWETQLCYLEDKWDNKKPSIRVVSNNFSRAWDPHLISSMISSTRTTMVLRASEIRVQCQRPPAISK